MQGRSVPEREHLEVARFVWDLEGSIHLIRQVENFVYRSRKSGRDVVLRVTEPSHRGSSEVQSELDWMTYLANNGLSIATPIRSENGNLLEELKYQGKTLYASLFEFASGAPLNPEVDFNSRVFETWGEFIGKLHRLTESYQPSSGIQPRADWNQDVSYRLVQEGMALEGKGLPSTLFREVLLWMEELPRDSSVYGLIHADLHHGNFFWDQGRITAFDFDDSYRHWKVFDLAVPLVSIEFNYCKRGMFQEFDFHRTRDDFLRGYFKEQSLESKWVDRIAPFGLYRKLSVYFWIRQRLSNDALDQETIEWSHELRRYVIAALVSPPTLV